MRFVEFLLLLSVGFVGCQGRVLLNYSLGIDSAELVTNPCQDVRLAGFICVDCSTLGFCSYINGQWQTVEMSSCQSERGFYCSDEETYGCTWQPRCKVPVRGKFYCQGEGVYPDPYDCRSYHECSAANVDTPRQCTNGAAYSLLTQSCSLPRDSEQCSQKQYSCSYLGQTGVWAANSSYYYICQQEETVFYPLMMKCRDGYTFNGHSCSSPVQTRAVQQQQEKHLDRKLVVCRDGERFASDNPNAYFACHAGQLAFHSCPIGHYFDAVFKMCRYNADSCEEGESSVADSKYGFNYCLHGQLIYQRCPIKYYFDEDAQACRQLAETCRDFSTSPAETAAGFYTCIKGQLHYQLCPAETAYYDEQRDVCVQRDLPVYF
ncbi:uncharacterized protein LOC132790141 [Drosophila nasuta]|uniref:uncharacterized protein LOC132790141 n=1 Tax=Drosophila nasuta TaxID=42062 RepID=UPI00295E8319|nr:uncharacterized protein LOC132790141 [Drosophila nasuta]